MGEEMVSTPAGIEYPDPPLMELPHDMRQDQEAFVSLPSTENQTSSLDMMEAMLRRFLDMGNIAEVFNAVQYPQEVNFDILGLSFHERFKQTGNLDDISKAIKYQQRSVGLTPEGHDDMPPRLNNLGNSFQKRFEQTGKLNDISKAIKFQQRAIALTPESHDDMPTLLTNLGISLWRRFERANTFDDISEAIKYQQRAVALTPGGHPGMPSRLSSLATSFLSRSEQTGNINDISKAIEYAQRAVALSLKDNPDLHTMLTALGASFCRRFDQTGNLDDISQAIKYQQRAVALTWEGHPMMPAWLSNLGGSFLCRFERTGNINDLIKSIEYQERTVALTPKSHANMPIFLNNLGRLFLCCFEHTLSVSDISKGIEYLERAVALMPEDHAKLEPTVNNLGIAFLRRFQRAGEPDDISKAIRYHQQALRLTPEGHANERWLLNNLGNSFKSSFRQTGKIDDISKAIEYQQRAIALTPEGHANMAWLLNNLGDSLRKRFQHTNDLVDCKAAIAKLHLAATQSSGRPSIRLDAARQWARSSARLDDLAQSLRAYAVAVELLPLIVSLDQTIQNRHQNLIDISSFTPEAVLAAILAENADTALEWLEQGRCLVWAQLNQLRTPVEQLQAYDAPLADQFLTVSKALESSGSRPELFAARETTFVHHMKVEDEVRTHLKLAQEWDQLLARIRHIPKFHDFLRPRKAATILSQIPPEGPIVIINVNNDRCDALALLHDAEKVIHIPLNDFTHQKVEDLQQSLRNYLSSNGLVMRDDRAGRPSRNATKNGVLRHILRELWNGLVKPILDGLGYRSMSSQRPRIWWCPTGPLAFLPIHAAGIYGHETTTPGMCLSDYAVSSYIPTVSTLLEKRSHYVEASQSDTQVLLISQPNTPGLPSIPGTTIETQAIMDKLTTNGIKAVRLEDEEATVERVEEGLQSHQWVHFACHASQDSTDPLKSSFFLHDGQLELVRIIRQELPQAKFAFLSACQTSVGDEKLSDEAVHLAAGMLAAGYQGVVGTMWSIGDGCAPKIAKMFYDHLLQERTDSGSHPLTNNRAAYALDHAIQKMRHDLPDDEHSMLNWVPYVHYGL